MSDDGDTGGRDPGSSGPPAADTSQHPYQGPPPSAPPSVNAAAAEGPPNEHTPAPADATPGEGTPTGPPPSVTPAGADEPPRMTRSDRRRIEKGLAPRGDAAPAQRKPHRKAPWWELPALVALAVAIAIIVKSFVVQPFYIPSESMEKTLHGCTGCHGDRILVNKPIYDFRDPHPGDIVVFHAPSGWDSEPASTPPSNPVLRVIRGFGQLVGFVPPDGQVLVKRVIAIGGQTVKGDAQGHVMISTGGANGTFRTLVEPYVYAPAAERGNTVPFGPVTVPKGRLWVMGDHRTDSADSRFHCSPDQEGTANDSTCDPTSSTIPVNDVIGKAFVIAWPPSRWRTLGTPATFTSAAGSLGSALPGVVSAGTVLPLVVLRRRRRRVCPQAG